MTKCHQQAAGRLTSRPVCKEKTFNMLLQPASRIILAILIICFYISSGSALPVLGIFETETGANDASDQIEMDQDFFFEPIAAVIIPALLFIKSELNKLDFQSASLTPLSPPPQPL